MGDELTATSHLNNLADIETAQIHLVRTSAAPSQSDMYRQLLQLIRKAETGKVPHITIANEGVVHELLTNPMKIDQNTLKIEIEANGATRVFSRHINRKEMCEPYENPAGGFVESTADVSEMAYVSPLTAVLENVKVLEGAILMGQRVIKGGETIGPMPISDHADVTA